MHQNTADEIGINRDPDAKECNFLLQFGGRGYALAESITNKGVPTTPQQGDSYKIRYDQLYPNVKQQREYWLAEHQKFGFITYFTGRRRSVPGIDWSNRSSVHRAETTLANNAIQGVGQDFLKAAIIRTDWRCINVDKAVMNSDIVTTSSVNAGYGKYGRDHLLLLKDYARKVEKARKIFKLAKLQYALQVHDELVHFCLAEAYEEVAPMISEMMCWMHPFPRHPAYRYCVPLVAEGGVGYNWLQAKGKDKKNPPILSLKEGYNSYELEKP
jgi:DNA polymerase I-like protein with 3'-5' exonuclease and polymerase domains